MVIMEGQNPFDTVDGEAIGWAENMTTMVKPTITIYKRRRQSGTSDEETTVVTEAALGRP